MSKEIQENWSSERMVKRLWAQVQDNVFQQKTDKAEGRIKALWLLPIEHLIDQVNAKDPEAQYVYGRRLMDGKGVDQSKEKGLSWMMFASEAGVVQASHYLTFYFLQDAAKGYALSRHLQKIAKQWTAAFSLMKRVTPSASIPLCEGPTYKPSALPEGKGERPCP